jgi:AsmA family
MLKSRRILLLVAAILAVGIALLGSMRWQISTGSIRPGLERALHRDTGYRIASLGEAAITIFPWPVLQISRLELGKPGSQETASVPLMKARLNVYSWLKGDPRITALTLFEPRVDLTTLDDEPEAAATLIWAFLRSDPRPSLTMLRVQGAQVLVRGAPLLRNLAVNITNIAANDVRLRAAGQYRGQPVSVTAVASPGARTLSRSFQWQLTAILMSPLSLDAAGKLKVTLGAAALRSRPLSIPLDLAILLDGLSLEGEGRLAFPLLQLGSVTVSRRGLRLDGALDLNLSLSAPRLAATLHATELDAGPLVALSAEALAFGLDCCGRRLRMCGFPRGS